MAKTPERAIERATLQQVAERAGVSPTTASLVLGGKAGPRRISAEANVRVQKAAAELNYAPNLLVRSLRRGRTHIISFYSAFRHRDASDLYMDRLTTAIEWAGGEFGYDILVHCNYTRSPLETYQFLNGGLADGVLMFAPLSGEPLVELFRRSNLPVVLINARDAEGMLSSVGDDSSYGMKSIAETLWDLGHRNIVAMGECGALVHDSDRRLAMLARDWHSRGGTMRELRIENPRREMEGVIKGLKREKDHPTALFCWNDRMAYTALEACDHVGISVPTQLSVIGYDGIRWPSATSHVAASVRVDLELLAQQAIKLLDRHISGYDGPLIEETLPISFSPGTTLGPISRNSLESHP